jgi:gliding motility-associated lipoprotein GldD
MIDEIGHCLRKSFLGVSLYTVLMLVFLALIPSACQEPVVVKPAAFLRLDFPEPIYSSFVQDCPYEFDLNQFAKPRKKERCALNLEYPFMGATVYLTYQGIQGDLPQLLSDAQKLTYDHTIKASEILEQPRVDPEHEVYGMYYQIDGPAASHAQFYLTDSTRHFLTGALYFNTKPNFDSLYPAINYVRQDIRRMMETLRWQ